MKTPLIMASVVLPICAFGILFLPARAQEDATEPGAVPTITEVKPGAAKWQHLALQHDASKPFSTPELARKINELGEAGWEMVNVLNFQKDGTTTKTVYYFKRPL